MATKKTEKEGSDDGLDLSAVLKRLERLAGSGGYPHLTMSATKKGTLLSATGNGNTVAVSLKEQVDGLSEPLNFNFASLIGLVNNRSSISMSVKAGTLVLNMKRFNASIVGVEASSVPVPKAAEGDAIEFQLNGDMRTIMADALAAVNIQKPLAALPDITVHLSFKKKVVSVTAFDKSQMANFQVANTTGQVFELTIPLPRAEALFKGLIGDAVVTVANGHLFAKSGNYSMSMSLPPPEEASGVPIDRVMARVAQLREMTLPKHVDIKREDLASFLDNAKVFFKSTAMLNLEVSKEGKSKVTVSSEGNTATGTISTKSKSGFHGWIDLSYISAVMSKSKGEVLGVSFDDSIFIFKDESLVYSAVLSEPPSAPKKKAKKEDADEE